ncbi:MAG: NAD(P)-binding protein [Chloroflexota bacterium]|jgi:2-polyprenyl-6-methoxyphenol hydroxylase-like FAD-dependent oxidoreductase
MGLSIGIVGGSIAGCSAAILLSRAGHQVRVFERSRGGLVGRGGGIATTGVMWEELVTHDVVDEDMPHFKASEMPFIVRTADEPMTGRVPYAMPLDLRAFHWTELWGQLRRRVPDGVYHQGTAVASVEAIDGHAVDLVFEDGSGDRFDLVIFADGYRSVGRQHVCPGTELRYRGYMLWRGLLPESAVVDAPLGADIPRLSYTELKGNATAYFVPSAEGSTAPGERIINWACYIPLSDDQVEAFMLDRTGAAHEGSIPPGAMRLSEEDRLKALMQANLPDWYGDMIARTSDTYVQLIYTARLSAYAHGRVCLIGDAGVVAQPFTGSGVFKGYQNVNGLLAQLSGSRDLDAALAAWSAEQVRLGDRLLALGEQMEQAFIWDSIDLASASSDEVAAWWKAAVTFPEEFTYQAKS